MKVGVFISINEHTCDDIRKMHALGFDNCQLNLRGTLREFEGDGSWEQLAEEINAVCAELDFKISAVFASWTGYLNFAYPEMYKTLGFVPADLRYQRMQEVLQQADYARKLGVKNVFTHIGYVRDDPHDEQRQAIAVTLRYIADHLAKYGQSLQIETGEMLPVSLVQLICEIGRDNVGVNFDPSNLMTSGRANSRDALDLLLPYVKGMHAKDGNYPSGTNPKGDETPIGEGQVDFPYIIRRLHESGYDGYITIEREISGEQQIRDIRKAAEYLRALIEATQKALV